MSENTNPVIGKDLKGDLPCTVRPFMCSDEEKEQLREYADAHRVDGEDEKEYYIWRKADEFMMGTLADWGYLIRKSRPFEDCIGYRCVRNGIDYTIFMYAYGQERTGGIDGESCKHLLDEPFSAGSTVLIMYLNVYKYIKKHQIKYQVRCFTKGKDDTFDFWELYKLGGKTVFRFYPRKEIVDNNYKLIYAFNHESREAYDALIDKDNPEFTPIGDNGKMVGSLFLGSLINLHRRAGDMKICFVRYNDTLYNMLPYIEGYGYFSFTVTKDNRIKKLRAYSFDNDNIKEVIYTDEKADRDSFGYIPRMLSVDALPPQPTERFALRINYDNGEVRKYIMSVDKYCEEKEVLSQADHVFTDKIWASAKIVIGSESDVAVCFAYDQVVLFKNEFYLSPIDLYLNSVDFSEPTPCDDIIFEDDRYIVKRLWTWDEHSVHPIGNAYLSVFNESAKATSNKYSIITPDGKYATTMTFDQIGWFSENRVYAYKDGLGYGYLDENLRIAVPFQYQEAEEFERGSAQVQDRFCQIYIDHNGNILSKADKGRYPNLGAYGDRMLLFSTMDFSGHKLAYYHEYEFAAGWWGYLDENGKEAIPPQFIFAFEFADGRARVCRGKWKEGYDGRKDRYGSDEELWGYIDKNGNEVIPCIYDEISEFWDEDHTITEVFAAHTGGWEDGKWGIMDRNGNWIVEPLFPQMGYFYKDGLIDFSDGEDDKNGELFYGVYDIFRHRLILEPKFIDISFSDNGTIIAQSSDGWAVYNRDGSIVFDGDYDYITDHHLCPGCYYVTRYIEENGKRVGKHGLLDGNGSIIIPCEYDIIDICREKRLFSFMVDQKVGVMDFDLNVIIPSIHLWIKDIDRSIYTLSDGKISGEDNLITPEGKVLFPHNYRKLMRMPNREDLYIGFNGVGCEMLEVIRK